SDDCWHQEGQTRRFPSRAQAALLWEASILKAESFTSAVERGTDSCRVLEWTTEIAPVGSSANGLDTALMQIAHECGASFVLALWHRDSAEAQVVSACHRTSTPAYELAA